MFVQDQLDAVQLTVGKAIVLAKAYRTCGAVQIEDGLWPWTDDVNVCWPMIVGINDGSQIPNSQDGRHRRRITYS